MNRLSKLFMPPVVTTYGEDVDALFTFILLVSVIAFVAVLGCIVFFVIKYRYRNNGPKADVSFTHSTKMEVSWTLATLALVLFIFGWGFKTFMTILVPPKNSMVIEVTASQFQWSFYYPDSGIRTTREIYVPVGKPVELHITSSDVIHSFWPPSFRTKIDAVPNKTTVMWFQMTKGGTYPVYCNEYCGAGHSTMRAKITGVSPYEFEQWKEKKIKEAAALSTPEGKGQKTFEMNCASCHSVQKPVPGGPKSVGPSLYGIFGTEVDLTDGRKVLIDESYIKRSIQDPSADIVAGYLKGAMPTGLLKDPAEIDNVVRYIKSLGDKSAGVK